MKFPTVSGSRTRLLAEGRAASALNHPAIAGVYDCGELDGSPYIVMELVEGCSLDEVLKEGPLTPARSLEIAVQVAQALSAAHGCHIIHRDIKPSNIRISTSGKIKVVDFGLAKLVAKPALGVSNAAETQTIEGAVIGTPQYMAPEQARGDSGDERSDIFSLGAVLYECLTGVAPFRGANLGVILAQLLQTNPPAPSRVNLSVPASLDAIVRKALAKNQADRYQSAAEMLAALEGLSLAGPSLGRPALRFRFPASPRARGGALAVALILASGGFWLARSRRVYQPGPDVLRWYRAGVEAIRDGTYFKAAKELERAEQLDPSYTIVHARLAEAYNELDDTNQANREMVKAGEGAVTLSRADRQTIASVRAILAGDYSEAVKIYRTILSDAPSNERAPLYVELGRALEKAENPAEAMDSFAQAAKLRPDYPAAFVRIGVLAGRRRERARAEEAFKSAELLYSALSNTEGVTEVAYQRAVQAAAAGAVDDAAALLERARRTAENAGNDYQAIAVLLQLVVIDLSRNAISEADKHVASALDLARRKGLDVQTARGLLTQGNVQLVRGNAEAALQCFRPALESAVRIGAKRTEARAHLSLASAYSQQSEYAQAAREIEQGLRFYEHGGYQTERAQALVLLGRARRESGDLEGASAAFQRELDQANSANDSAQKALALEGLGTCDLYHELYSQALAHFQDRTSATSGGNVLGLAFGSVQTGAVLWRLGRYHQAGAALKKAHEIVDPVGGSRMARTQLEIAEAEMALSEERFDDARALARRLMAPDGDQAEAKRIFGEAAVRQGFFRDGERACGEALAAARALRLPLQIPPLLVCHAEGLTGSGKHIEAMAEARQAQEDAARAGRKETEGRAWLARARAAAASGDQAATRDCAARAQQAFDELAQTINAEDRAGLASRKDLQQWRKQARALLSGSARPRAVTAPTSNQK